MAYLWIKALHVIAIVSWMAGMLYLPRLFVYHAEAGARSEPARLFQVMELRLQRYIMLPALIVVWLTGLYLAMAGGFFVAPWLHAKLLLVLAMTGFHGWFARLRRGLADGTDAHTPRFFRILNEGPTVLLVGIVILVIVKPFS